MSSSFTDKSTASWGPPRSPCPRNATWAADGCCDDVAGGGAVFWRCARTRATTWSIRAKNSSRSKNSSPLKSLHSPASSASCPNDGRGTWREPRACADGRGTWRATRACDPPCPAEGVAERAAGAVAALALPAGREWRSMKGLDNGGARRVFDVLQLLNDDPGICALNVRKATVHADLGTW